MMQYDSQLYYQRLFTDDKICSVILSSNYTLIFGLINFLFPWHDVR